MVTFLSGTGVLNLCAEANDFQEAFRMFEAVYGQTYFGEGQTNSNKAGLERVKFVQRKCS